MNSFDLFRAIGTSKVHSWAREIIDRHSGKDIVVPPDHVLRDGVGIAYALRILSADFHEAIRLRIRQRFEEDFIDDAEDSGIRANT